MPAVVRLVQLALLVATSLGSFVWMTALASAFLFERKRRAASDRAATAPHERADSCPPLTLLKPVYGLEKHLRRNLRTACVQDYPDYQVVFSVQTRDDPAIPLLHELAREFGEQRVSVAIESARVGLNGKINNLAGALPHARHDLLVISDSDVRLRADFLRTIVTPLSDARVGAVSTFFRATDADTWYERMELLTLNADQFALAIVAQVTGLVDFCFGASTALTKETLASIGGLEALGEYLVEDNEMGRRIVASGKRLVVVPYVVDTMVDLDGPASWWRKQTYWDQNTRAAIPGLFAASVLLRTIPLAMALVLARGGDVWGFSVFVAALAIRLLSAAAVLGVALRDREGLKSLWLLPIKDVLSLFWFVRAFLKRTVVWRGAEMAITRDGRLRALPAGPST